MQAYGSDRVRPGEGERFVLMSRFPKQWTPRAAKTLTSAEFPGTAVLWEERYFEVVDAEGLPQGGVKYVLEPWRDMHIMRTTDRYDADREAERLIEWRAGFSREKKRKAVNALALLTGHFPAIVQEELGRELGVMPRRLTLISAAGAYIAGVGLAMWCVSFLLEKRPVPLPLFLGTAYLLIETSLRLLVGWLIGRPMGSAVGVFGYIGWHFTIADRSRAISPFGQEKGMSIAISETPVERAASDALLMRESLVTLLPPHDQARVAARFGYDYRRQSRFIAAVILVFASLGIFTSIHNGAVISLLLALFLAGEQLFRLAVLGRRPAGSVLGILARPFVRKLL
ncbi:MAG: hypothetical protein QOC81_4017 [Thermoanaerobaculia bacterium]|jgi:hypothetical protein|nr:hypothetical protein [Thermoanaerobaculia bacterium]